MGFSEAEVRGMTLGKFFALFDAWMQIRREMFGELPVRPDTGDIAAFERVFR
jgi:hypothetical protein